MRPDKEIPWQIIKKKEILKTDVVELTPNDWEVFRDNRLKSLKTDPLAFGPIYDKEVRIKDSTWKIELSDPNFKCFASKQGEKIIAGTGVYFSEDQTAWLSGFFVDPDYREHGVGESLMNTIIEKLQVDFRVVRIELGVFSTQEAAIQMYKKLGFKQVVREKYVRSFEGKAHDLIVMEFKLRAK